MPSHLILRTNFVTRDPWPFPRAFVDRFGTFLFTDEVAAATSQLLEQKLEGLVHVAGEKRLSMYDAACLTTPGVQPMVMADVNLPLTVDMTLRSVRIQPFRFTSSELAVASETA